MGTTKLKVYNSVATLLGEYRLNSLSEDIPLRRKIDSIWDDMNIQNYCLEQGLWRFAKRTVKLDYDPNIDTSEFGGYQYAVGMPSDHIRTIKVSSDEYLRTPVHDMAPEGNYIYSDYQTLYMQYVSNSELYGGDLANWPETYADYVAHEIAYRASKPVQDSDNDKQILRDERDEALRLARNRDAMSESTRFFPRGNWVTSRNRSGRRNAHRTVGNT